MGFISRIQDCQLEVCHDVCRPAPLRFLRAWGSLSCLKAREAMRRGTVTALFFIVGYSKKRGEWRERKWRVRGRSPDDDLTFINALYKAASGYAGTGTSIISEGTQISCPRYFLTMIKKERGLQNFANPSPLSTARYSASSNSKIFTAAVATGVPGPKIAAAPSLYNCA